MPENDAVMDEAETLIARLKELRPDLAVVPREPWRIMAMRGYQAEDVLYPCGMPMDWLSIPASVQVAGWPDMSGKGNGEDERMALVVAGIWRGCIEGHEEWTARMAEERGRTPEHDRFLDHWAGPVPTRAEDSKPEESVA